MPAFDGSPSWDDPADFLGREPDWRDQGACNGHPNPDLWFPEPGTVGAISAREAKRICAGCVVQQECLHYAMTVKPEPTGVWGGTTPKDRRNMRRQRRKAA